MVNQPKGYQQINSNEQREKRSKKENELETGNNSPSYFPSQAHQSTTVLFINFVKWCSFLTEILVYFSIEIYIQLLHTFVAETMNKMLIVGGKVRTTTQTRNNKTIMTSVDAYIYIIIGLLGVAYPILLQVVAHLDEKYSSELITKLFKKEWEYNAFRYSLYSSLIFVGIWSLKLPPLIHMNYPLNVIIENSGDILIALNTIILVIFFFMYARKVLNYYTQTVLISHLIKKHNESQS